MFELEGKRVDEAYIESGPCAGLPNGKKCAIEIGGIDISLMHVSFLFAAFCLKQPHALRRRAPSTW